MGQPCRAKARNSEKNRILFSLIAPKNGSVRLFSAA